MAMRLRTFGCEARIATALEILLATGAGQPDILAATVQRANADGKLVAGIQGSWRTAIIPQLVDACKRRYG